MSHTIPTTMTAIHIAQPGGPKVLIPASTDTPQQRPHEVLIQVEAAGVNRPDIMQRKGQYPVPANASPLPGLEVAGKIVALGHEVTGWSLGQNVVALTNGGGYAQFVAVPAGQILPLPDGMNMVEGASLPEICFTVHQALSMRGGLKSGQSLLVQGGASGIGGMAIQLAKAVGATVYCTLSSEEKAEYATSLGADATINYRTEDFVERVSTITSGRGVDMVLNIIGGEAVNRNLKCLAPHGTLVQLALLGGAKAEINFGLIISNYLNIFGSALRPQSDNDKAEIARSLFTNVWPLFADHTLKLPRIRTFDLTDAAAAHHAMESPDHFGKIVLTVT